MKRKLTLAKAVKRLEILEEIVTLSARALHASSSALWHIEKKKPRRDLSRELTKIANALDREARRSVFGGKNGR